ncbi:cysteine proteinase [Cylindrobasidium torrendii FP15055 ss-10]|uniref:Cysteine proteinase n=1 Tax=Cylindrobasidium torrendii FP15055 ss-10 TaxID=1314674 RepID=A0A0D7ARY8_9AGAR|nr:cysteine proteinase [Cylindrobasidium torrendii FP15055 ss-10]
MANDQYATRPVEDGARIHIHGASLATIHSDISSSFISVSFPKNSDEATMLGKLHPDTRGSLILSYLISADNRPAIIINQGDNSDISADLKESCCPDGSREDVPPPDSPSAAGRNPSECILVFPFPWVEKHDGVRIFNRDITVLESMEMLNDNHIAVGTKGYQAVQKWTKRVDIFKKTYLLIPIHRRSEKHWFLTVIYIPDCVLDDHDFPADPRLEERVVIYTLDSLGNSRHEDVAKTLRKYLASEANDKRQQVLRRRPAYCIAQVPSQPNLVDCGFYLLHFCHMFLTERAKCTVLLNAKQKEDELLKSWEAENIGNHRSDLKNELLLLGAIWQRGCPPAG